MITKILIPLDGSQLAENALPYARDVAHKFKAELTLVQVLLPKLSMPDYEAGFYSEKIKHQQDIAKIYLNNVKGTLREAHIPLHTAVLDGEDVAETIIEFAAEKEMDLIVISTHGRSGVSRWVYGSVATKVLQEAPCPVFLVRAKEETAA